MLTEKRDGKICSFISNSSGHCRIFAEIWHIIATWVPGGFEIVKANFRSNPRWRTPPDLLSLNHYNSAADCSILLIFCIEFYQVTTMYNKSWRSNGQVSRSQS